MLEKGCGETLLCSRVLNPSAGKGVWGDTFVCVYVRVSVCPRPGVNLPDVAIAVVVAT